MAVILLMTACGSKQNNFESRFFAANFPEGMDVQAIETGTLCDGVMALNEKDQTVMGMTLLPFDTDAQTMLQTQTYGGSNPALRGMTFGEMVSADVDGHKGWKVPMSGQLQGFSCIGDVYAINIDNCCVVAFVAAAKDMPEGVDEFLKSITINKEEVEKFQSDPKEMVDAVVQMANTNCPMMVDEQTTWSTTEVNNSAKEVYLIMNLQGEADQWEVLKELEGTLREEMLASLRESKKTDLLIDVPVNCGYSIGYKYFAEDSTSPLLTITFTPEDFK